MFDLSIEITSYNRKDVLRTQLEGLSDQSWPCDRFEVVISDDGSDDGLLDMLDTLLPDLPFETTLLRHDHKGPGHAHNRGIEACRAELVLMLAADILPDQDLVAEHIRSHRENPAVNVVVCGYLVQSPSMPDTVIQRAMNVQVERAFRNAAKHVDHGGFLISNLSFKRQFMLEHGMFNEWPPASHEDVVCGYELKRAGMALIENERARGMHHHCETLASIAGRAYLAGYNSHHFVAAIDEPWVQRRFGGHGANGGEHQGVGSRLRAALRALLINRATTYGGMIPLIRSAERISLLAPLAPLLCQKITSYFFNRGVVDWHDDRPFAPPRLEP